MVNNKINNFINKVNNFSPRNKIMISSNSFRDNFSYIVGIYKRINNTNE